MVDDLTYLMRRMKTTIMFDSKTGKYIKKPVEMNWNHGANYRYNDPEFQKYLKTAKSYGILCGHRYGFFMCIDCDTEEMYQMVKKKLPPTRIVKTPGGYHLYYFCRGLKKTKVLYDKDGKHLGEIISGDRFIIGFGSVRPDGKRYERINDLPITEIGYLTLITELSEFFHKELAELKTLDEDKGLDMRKILNTSKVDISTFNPLSDSVIQGTHPVHGAENGKNLEIDFKHQQWFCYRCWKGGGCFSLIAVLEGVIDCKDATKGALKGKKGRKTAKIAIEKYGMKKSSYALSEKKKMLIAIRKLKFDGCQRIKRGKYKGLYVVSVEDVLKEMGVLYDKANSIHIGKFLNNELKLKTTKINNKHVIILNSATKKKLYRHFHENWTHVDGR